MPRRSSRIKRPASRLTESLACSEPPRQRARREVPQQRHNASSSHSSSSSESQPTSLTSGLPAARSQSQQSLPVPPPDTQSIVAMVTREVTKNMEELLSQRGLHGQPPPIYPGVDKTWPIGHGLGHGLPYGLPYGLPCFYPFYISLCKNHPWTNSKQCSVSGSHICFICHKSF